MPITPIPDILRVILREARVAARKLLRRLGLAPDHLADIEQELLVLVLPRLTAFDVDRGSIGAFVGKVMANQSAGLAARIRRDRNVFAPVSLDDPMLDADGITVGDTIPESGGYLAMMGSIPDFYGVDRRLDLNRALATLCPSDQALCAKLIDYTPTELSQRGLGSRATLYRQLHEIRLQLMTNGLSSAA